MITQLVCYHLPPSQARLAEFCAVLRQNVRNEQIARIDLFVEDAALLTCPWAEAEQMRRLWADPKIRIFHTHARRTYQALIDHANEHVEGLAMISNCDVHYDDTLQLLHKVNFAKFAVCLSKAEIVGDNQFYPLTPAMCGYSQDTWVFKPPLKRMRDASFFMGVQRCDNRIAWEFAAIGLRPINPANDIRSYHCHLSGVRTYRQDIDCVPGPVLFIKPPYGLSPEFCAL
jgi:hypothetical protein